MEKIKEYKYVILIVLLIIGYAFYWLQIRPELTRKECAGVAIDRINAFNEGKGYVPINERADRNDTDFNRYFERCILEKGLK